MNSSALILVIIYNKSVNDSETLKSLKQIKDITADLLIFNNGPERIKRGNIFIQDLEKDFKKVYLAEDVENRPLSILYNAVIEEYQQYDTFFIFDDDTHIPSDYFIKTMEKVKCYDLVIPQIISNTDQSVCYPIINGKPYKNNTEIKLTDIVYSIGSGLVISKTLINKFKKKGLDLFDSRYALYGVDFSLFRRIRSLIDNGEKIDIAVSSSLNHSLAKRKKKKEAWRKKEITIDQVLTSKFYTKTYLDFLWILVKKILKLDFDNAWLACKVYKSGCHPRSKKYL
ncbi:hypothetical protein ACW9SN_003185 [Klebsiella quasipneumoniae]